MFWYSLSHCLLGFKMSHAWRVSCTQRASNSSTFLCFFPPECLTLERESLVRIAGLGRRNPAETNLFHLCTERTGRLTPCKQKSVCPVNNAWKFTWTSKLKLPSQSSKMCCRHGGARLSSSRSFLPRRVKKFSNMFQMKPSTWTKHGSKPEKWRFLGLRDQILVKCPNNKLHDCCTNVQDLMKC